MALEEIRLRACCIGAGGRCAITQCLDRASVHAATASGAALVGKDHAEVLDGLLDPAVACGRQRTRLSPPGPPCKKRSSGKSSLMRSGAQTTR